MITKEDHLLHLRRGTKQAAQEVAESGNADSEVLDHLLALEWVPDHSWTRRLIARHPNLSAAGFELLANDHDESVREDLMTNPSISVDTLVNLYADKPGRYLLQAMAHNTSLPADIQLDMAEKNSDNSWILKALAANPSLDASVVPVLVASTNDYVRKEIARRHLLTVDQQWVLARDESKFVRAALAENSSVDAGVLDHLARNDEDSFVRKGVAGNRSTPGETLRFLTEDENYFVKRDASRNRNIAG